MLLNLATSEIYSGLFGDAELASLLSEASDIGAMIEVERALARAQGAIGLIPQAAAEAIDTGLRDLRIDPADLASGAAAAGIAVPALLPRLREVLPVAAGHWLHWGATSQDIADTATILQMKRCLARIGPRLTRLIDLLQQQARAHDGLVMAARTRGQVATPITLGLKLAQWAAPLIEAEASLDELRGAVLRVQFGGASGANTAIAPQGAALSAALAGELGLADGPPWHVNRTPVLRIAAWLMQVAAALAKIGADLLLLGRSEIGELRAGSGGGSSTMPQKANPVEAEALVSLERLAATLQGGLAHAASPAEERDGAAWAVEWMLLPQLVLACGASLLRGLSLVETLQPRPEAMQATLARNPGTMAEAASFALAAHMPRAEAQQLIRECLSAPVGFGAALAARVPGVDWASVLDPASVIAPCQAGAARIFSARLRPEPAIRLDDESRSS